MLIGGDERLNLVQVFDESLQNVLTQTMINQDVLFRNQVLELHRLYQIQNILMKEMDLKLNGEFNVSRESANSFGCPFPKQLIYEALATEKIFCEIPMICSSTCMKNNFLQEHCSTCLKQEQSHKNLELPASYHTNDSENSLYEKYSNITPAVSENGFDDDNTSSMEELKLEVCVKKSTEDKLHSEYSSQELVEGTGSNGFPVSCKSDSIPGDESCKENTGHICIDMEKSNSWPSTLQASKEQCHHNGVPCSDRKIKSQLSNQKKQKLTEVDIRVKNGAVSLLCISSVSLARDQESNRRMENGNAERDVSQYSSESYESIVLKQQESSIDSYSMTSTLLEGHGLNENGYGIKLKRGRRMKNFQKEILPVLASLSRQEICEDVRIMRATMRSREYKKYGSKMSGISNCFSPVKCKRSRQCYVGRR